MNRQFTVVSNEISHICYASYLLLCFTYALTENGTMFQNMMGFYFFIKVSPFRDYLLLECHLDDTKIKIMSCKIH